MRQGFIEIGINDQLPDVIRKSNQNFKLLNSGTSRQFNSQSSEIEAGLAEVASDLAAETANRINNDNSIISSLSNYATKSEIATLLEYKGSVHSEADLPSSGQSIGDTYNIETESSFGEAGMNVVWTENGWDALGTAVTRDYDDLTDKPSIEGVTLSGDKTFPELGIFIDPEETYPQSDEYALETLEIDAIWNLAMA